MSHGRSSADLDVPHDCVLFLPDGVDVPPTELPGRAVAGGWGDASDAVQLTFGDDDNAGATIDNFELIAEFSSLVCDATLAARWQDLAAVDVEIVLPGGTLTAVADDLTNTQIWSWGECDGQPVLNKRLTSCTVFEAAAQRTTLEITPRQVGGQRGQSLSRL